MSHALDHVFNVSSSQQLVTTEGEVIVEHDTELQTNADADYQLTRNNLHTLLVHGQSALMHALEVAKASEHPRAFEVVGGLMKQLADINHQLIDLTEKRRLIKDADKQKSPDQSQPGTVNNNAIFVGSTAELSEALKLMNRNKT